MTSLVKVSVIIPVYNSKKYIKGCLDSVLAQSMRDIEVVVVDDGSTDGSWDILQKYAFRDVRVIPIRQKNLGVSAARNTGLRRAAGEYVGFVDSDDHVDPGYFESLYQTAIKEDADIVTGYVSIDDEKRQHFYNYTSKRMVMKNKNLLMGVVWANIYKRITLETHNVLFPEDLRTAEDNVFNLQASYYANKVVRAKDDTAVYHQIARSNSLTTQQSNSHNLVQLAAAMHKTVSIMNTLNGYNEEAYITRFTDTLSYFHRHYIAATHIGVYAKHRIIFEVVSTWRKAKHRELVLKSVESRGIDLENLMTGRLYGALYNRYIVNAESVMSIRNTAMKLREMKSNLKIFIKKTARAVLPYGFVDWYKRRNAISGITAPDENKIGIVAAYRETKYVELLKQSVKDAGYKVSDYAGGAKYVWLHWYENGVNDHEDFYRKIAMMKAWKDQGKKIIVHIHNKKPHESPVPNLSHALMTMLYDSADHISIMSEETKKLLEETWYYGDDFSRVSKTPHPNYVDAYGSRLEAPETLNNDTLKILFFGQVRPYKGVEKLLKVTEGLSNIEISILGTPKDEKYVERLHELCKDRSNVKFRLEFIPDDEIPRIFSEHHIVALPYSIDSSLNSGAAILALSYARTVVGTNNGTLKELGDDSLYFGYDYQDDQDHIEQLEKAIQTIHSQYSGRYNDLLDLGEKVFERVNEDNSIDAIAASIDDMIKRIG